MNPINTTASITQEAFGCHDVPGMPHAHSEWALIAVVLVAFLLRYLVPNK